MTQPQAKPQPDDLEKQDDLDLTHLSLKKKGATRADSPDQSEDNLASVEDDNSSEITDPPAVKFGEYHFDDPPAESADANDQVSEEGVVVPKWALAAIALVVISLLIAVITTSARNSENAANATVTAEAGGTATQQAISQLSTSEAGAATATARFMATSQSGTATLEWRATATTEAIASAHMEATKTAEERATATTEMRIIQNGRATDTAEKSGTATAEARLNATATANHLSTATAETRKSETATTIAYATSIAAAQATSEAIKATQTAEAARPDLIVSMMECQIEYDLFSRFGQVAHAWVTVQNIGTANATNIEINLSASDKVQDIPDSHEAVLTLPPGYQVTQKLTVDTYLLKTTDITIDVSSSESASVRKEKSACPRNLNDTTKAIIANAGTLGKIVLIAALK